MNRTKKYLPALAAASLIHVAAPLSAETRWDTEAELGFLLTSGNTEQTKINARLASEYETEQWRHTGEARSLFAKAESETDSEKYLARAQSDYKFSDSQFLFISGNYEDDRFSGYDFQASMAVGYGQRVWETAEGAFLELSGGPGYRFNKLKEPDEDGDDEEKGALVRLAADFSYPLSETATFRQKLSSEYGIDDENTISESETSLQATLTGSLSLKAAVRVKHLSEPPEGDESTDTETTLSLLYGF